MNQKDLRITERRKVGFISFSNRLSSVANFSSLCTSSMAKNLCFFELYFGKLKEKTNESTFTGARLKILKSDNFNNKSSSRFVAILDIMLLNEA